MDVLSIMDAHGAGRKPAKPQFAAHGDEAAMRKAAEDFEAQFLAQMFQLAMKDSPVNELFGGGPGEKMFRELLTDEWAANAARSGGVGIADAVLRTLVDIQAETSQ